MPNGSSTDSRSPAGHVRNDLHRDLFLLSKRFQLFENSKAHGETTLGRELKIGLPETAPALLVGLHKVRWRIESRDSNLLLNRGSLEASALHELKKVRWICQGKRDQQLLAIGGERLSERLRHDASEGRLMWLSPNAKSDTAGWTQYAAKLGEPCRLIRKEHEPKLAN